MRTLLVHATFFALAGLTTTARPYRIQQAYQWDVLDKPIPRTYGPVK